MGKIVKDLTGKRFGMLVVISFDHEGNGTRKYWNCKCDCGGTRIVSGDHLARMEVTDCGCYRKHIPYYKTHGMSNSRIYTIWSLMKERCFNKKRKEYPNYGGRGIKVCDEWLNPSQFINWALNNGYSDDLTLDRKDNDKDYCPQNCRWVDRKTQQNNTRRNRYITWNNKTKNIAQWSIETGLPRYVITKRLYKLGWSVEEALTKPVIKKYSNKKGSDT